MTSNEFKYITIRARVSYSICCLENAITHYNLQNLDWSLLFNLLWKYPTADNLQELALWHENEAECCAFCIMDDLPYEKCEFEYISLEQYTMLKELYINSNKTIWTLTDLITSIATLHLYGGVRNGAPETLSDLDKVMNLMNKENITLPDFTFFNSYTYPKNPKTDIEVWGNKIEPKSLNQVSKWIMK
jgi:hypothetical protein